MTGEMATPSAAVTTSARNKAVERPATSWRVSSGDWRFLYSASTGTNACENAPSAKRRRSRFGMRNATKKASVASAAAYARAEAERYEEIAHIAEDAADQRQTAHRAQRPQQVHVLISRPF